MRKSLLFYSIAAALSLGFALLLPFFYKDMSATAHFVANAGKNIPTSPQQHWSVWFAWGIFGLVSLGLAGLGLQVLNRQQWTQRPLALRIGLAGLAYLALMLGAIAVGEAARRAIFSPTLNMDLANLLNLNGAGFMALLGLSVVPVALFLAAHRLTNTVKSLEVPLVSRAAALFVAAFMAYAIGMLLPAGAQGNLALCVGMGLALGVLFDFGADRGGPDFLWMVLMVLGLTNFTGYLLHDYHNQKDRNQRRAYAEALAVTRDTALAEPVLRRLSRAVGSDARLPLLLKPWPFKPDGDSVRSRLNALVLQEHYLLQHYRLQTFAFDGDDPQPLLRDQTRDRAYVEQYWSKGQPLEGTSDLRFTTSEGGKLRYMLHTRANRMQDPTHPVDIYCFYDQEYPQPTEVYGQLYYEQPYRGLAHLAQYDYAVLRDGKIVVEQGKVNPAAFGAKTKTGETLDLRSADGKRLDAVSQGRDGNTLAIVGRAESGWRKFLNATALLFTLATAFLFSLALLNWGLKILPADSAVALSAKGSLGKRIQYANLALLALGFLMVGGLVYWYFNASAREKKQADFQARAVAAQSYLLNQYQNLSPNADSLTREIPQQLAALANSLRIDANWYGPDGSLRATTRDDLRQLGILPNRMGTEAFAALSKGAQAGFSGAEQLRGRALGMQYLPLRNNQQQLLGFIGMPYRMDDGKPEATVSDFLGLLATLYTCLLLLAVVATLLLAETIARPINYMADKIKEVQFQEKNEQLLYSGDQEDEIGALIGEYNRMVDKLEVSKQKLIKLERDSAWREMARQIAHDIKNPLTTMKLSMQQLERVSNDPNPMQFALYLKKAIARLIEQIDALAQIASEFSMFANLEIRPKNDLSLNDVVESVYDLFSEQPEARLNLNMSPVNFLINADKGHLIRVLNNLIINAIQAIPEGREGVIDISLREEDKYAIVQISDNGGGIPPHIQERVFEPNFTTKSSGSGLGLAICRKIIEAHDGRIYFNTREGIGTDFYLALPIERVASYAA